MRLWRPLAIGAVLAMAAFGIIACSESTTPDDTTDTTAPMVASTQPSQGSVGVTTNASIVVTFNENMDAASGTGQVTLSSGGTPTLNWQDARILVITHSAAWAEGVQVTVTLGTGFADAAGNHLAAAYSFSFFTQTSNMLLLATIPTTGATGVNRSADVRLQFSFEADVASLQNGVTISDAVLKTLYPFTVDDSGSDTWVTLDITGTLPATTLITVNIAASVHQAGSPSNTLGAPSSFTFTTGATVDTTPPTIISMTPANGAVVNANTGILEIVFSEPVNPDTFGPTSWNMEMAVVFMSGNVQPVWSAGNTVLTVTLPTPLPAGLPMAFTFAGFADVNGNVQNTPYSWAATVAGIADVFPATDGLRQPFRGMYARGLAGSSEPTQSGETWEYRQMETQLNGNVHQVRYEDDTYTSPRGWEAYRKISTAINWVGFGEQEPGRPVMAIDFSGPLRFVPLPIAVGPWTSSTSVVIPGDGTYNVVLNGTVIGREDLPVPAMGGESGLYYKGAWKIARTLAVTLNGAWNSTMSDTTWYSPTLGPVRERSREDNAARDQDPAGWYETSLDRDFEFSKRAFR